MKHFLMCLLYIAALGVLSFVVGRLIPKHWFHADRFPWVCHPAEQKLWKRLHVRKWQAKIPDMSRIFVKIMPEKKLTKENYENLPRMIEETCVAEWTHILLSIAGLGLLKIWSGVGGVCITIIYIVLGNLPFIVVQRYNRPRLQKLFAMQQRKKQEIQMQTLILSCNTGAGHNSCAQAVQEAYHSRGEICNITDSLQFISEKASTFISNLHTRIYRHAPRLFDAGYQRAESHEDIFCEGTPIYKLLSSGAERMYQYIRSAGYDNIICTHVFPALALTEMRRQHPCLQLVTSHISTDYTCAPCTADSALDWYFIPSTSLLGEFEQCGLQPQKLIASGIPVRQQFYQRVSQEAGKANAGISPAHQHILMMCGSMGCGPMEEIISYLCPSLTTEQELSVVCGTNDDLRKKLQKRTEKYSQVHVLGTVNNVPQLMQASDLFLTKPGGLSTSEAMAAELPMVLIDAVAGCETHNLNFFLRNGMAVTANTPKAIADTTIKTLNAPVLLSKMRAAMRSQTECTAADKIYEWIYSHAK